MRSKVAQEIQRVYVGIPVVEDMCKCFVPVSTPVKHCFVSMYALGLILASGFYSSIEVALIKSCFIFVLPSSLSSIAEREVHWDGAIITVFRILASGMAGPKAKVLWTVLMAPFQYLSY